MVTKLSKRTRNKDGTFRKKRKDTKKLKEGRKRRSLKESLKDVCPYSR